MLGWLARSPCSASSKLPGNAARSLRDFALFTVIRHKLANWVRLTTTHCTKAGQRILCRQDSPQDAEAAALARQPEPGPPRVHTRTARS